MRRVQRCVRDETGMSLVFVGMGLMAFLSASMLAIDVGMLMTARNQAQNSADAGALAGATALALDDYADHSPTGPAVTSAITTGKANQVMGAQVSLNVSDVVFLNDPAGQPNRVKVTVYRRASRGNPLSTLIARYFGMATADISATATGEASPANAMTCVKPFTIPDRWIENQTPPWDPNDTFDLYDSKGNPLANPDVYIPATSPSYSGYSAERDKGMEVLLKADNGSKIAPSFYYPWAIPGNSGASDYRRDIAGCNSMIVPFGYDLTPEPGNMVGPTKSGMEDLIAKDPDAYWDTYANKVVSTMNPSPRVVAIPLFDPWYYEDGKHGGRGASLRAVNYLGFFIEAMQGNEVKGIITPIGGLHMGAGYGAGPTGAFPKSIRLVQ
jgi:Flp pilus assembly protein TadG